MKHTLRMSLLLLLTIMVLTVSALADSGPKPQLIVRLENPPEAVCRYQRHMNDIMSAMFDRMRRARATRRVDCDFLREMLPHHKGAVEMASITLQSDICPELVPILQAIITSQETGIAQMEALAASLRCRC